MWLVPGYVHPAMLPAAESGKAAASHVMLAVKSSPPQNAVL
jgi:hypothetical protein